MQPRVLFVLRRVLFVLLLGLFFALAARVSLLYPLYADLSQGQINSLPQTTRQTLEALPGPISITAYASDLPLLRRQIDALVARFRRHHHALQLRFVDPAYNPEQVRSLGIRRDGELLVEANGRTEHVLQPSEAALSQALLRLGRRGEDWVVSLGRGTGGMLDDGPRGLSGFGRLLKLEGYSVVEYAPEELPAVPDNTALLILPAPAADFAPPLQRAIQTYLERGGRLLWLNEHGQPDSLGSMLGVRVLPGRIVDAAAARLGLATPDHAIVSDYPEGWLHSAPQTHSVFPGAAALSAQADGEWRTRAQLESGSQSWNETGALRGQIQRDAAAGEQGGPLAVMLALERPRGSRPARVVVSGDIDVLSNQWLGRAGNRQLALGVTHWLTGNDALPTANPAPSLAWSKATAAWAAALFMFILPAAYLATGLFMRLRRRAAR